MEGPELRPLEAALAEARRSLAPFYLPPTLRSIDAGAGDGGSVERVGIDALAERLRIHDDHGARTTSFVAGAPGGGKTTLTRQLEARLLALGCPCVLLTAARLDHLGAVPADVKDLVLHLRPNAVSEERWWKAQAKKGKVVVLADAWNEIQRRHGADRDLGRLLRSLLREQTPTAPPVSLEEIGGRYLDRFSWPGRGRTWDVFLGQPTEKGPHAAQALLQDFVRSRPLELVLMVGMCGGLPEHGAKEGTVLLARQIFNYEPARVREGTAAWSPSGYRSTPRILDLANALASHGEFGDIKVQATKDYGSGESLIDDLASELRQKILAFSGDIVGFEMEEHGVLHAVWELQRTMHFEAGVAKGVADFGDGKQRDDKDARQRLATRNAAQVALKLLKAY